MSNKEHEKLVREAMTQIRKEQARTGDIGDWGKLEAIINATIDKAVAGVPDGMLSGGIQRMDAAQPQRSYITEWLERHKDVCADLDAERERVRLLADLLLRLREFAEAWGEPELVSEIDALVKVKESK